MRLKPIERPHVRHALHGPPSLAGFLGLATASPGREGGIAAEPCPRVEGGEASEASERIRRSGYGSLPRASPRRGGDEGQVQPGPQPFCRVESVGVW